MKKNSVVNPFLKNSNHSFISQNIKKAKLSKNSKDFNLSTVVGKKSTSKTKYLTKNPILHKRSESAIVKTKGKILTKRNELSPPGNI